MATYASNTNPFIQPTSPESKSISGQSRSSRKDAPGMAKPQRDSEADAVPSAEPLDLLDLEQAKKVSSVPALDSIKCLDTSLNNTTDAESVPPACCKSDNGKPDKETTEEDQASDSMLSDISVEVAKVTRDLVDATVKLQIDNSKDTDAHPKSDRKPSPGLLKKFIIEDDEDGDFDEESRRDSADNLELPPMGQDSRRHQHIELIKKLRLQLRDLERYAYERGELDEVPASVLAERQTVILNTLKERLSLNIDMGEIDKVELDELKEQVDKEIHELIDPFITKEHLLAQLKTQLTDLERYITHLHGTIGKNSDKTACVCHVHGCSSPMATSNSTGSKSYRFSDFPEGPSYRPSHSSPEALPRTSNLIRTIVTQLICSDIKLQEKAKKEQEFLRSEMARSNGANGKIHNDDVTVQVQQPQNGAAWTLHIDKVILARDSLVNLFTMEPKYQRPHDRPFDESVVESVVRRHLTPALRDLLSYGLIDPDTLRNSTSFSSFLFDPYYLLTSLTCLPSSQSSITSKDKISPGDKTHVWTVIEDYYNSRNEPNFNSSNAKTLSRSFSLAPSVSGAVKITSKQALLIAIDETIETLTKCKPNGPESHFRLFINTALNRSRLATWLRLVFKNKSLVKKYYHTFSFVSQADKMDKFLSTIEALNPFQFKLRTDAKSIEQFVSAF